MLTITQRLYLVLICVFISASALAQTNVQGVVSDEEGTPLVGATVSTSISKKWAVTNDSGEYSIAVSDIKKDTLVFNYIGMETCKIPISGKVVINTTMKLEQSYLNDVVVIGYNSVKRSDLTGSIVSAGASEIAKVPVNSLSESLTGKMAGVQVITSDGSPDADVSIYIRGRNSITQSSEPLYIVDGFPVSTISDLAPSDILSIDVMKDASATSIYGSRGANGVVLVTTKNAAKNGISVSFNAYMGLKYAVNIPKMLDTYEYALWQREFSTIKNDPEIYTDYFGAYEDIDLYRGVKGNDWQKIVFGDSALQQDYNIALSGKGESTSWNASYTRHSDDGVMLTSGYVRDNVLMKFQHRVSRKLVFDAQARFSNTVINGSGANEQTGGRSSDPRMKYVMQYSPIPMDSYSSAFDDEEFYKNSGLYTPTQYIRDNDRYQKRRTLALYAGLNWTIIEGLNLNVKVDYDLRYDEDQRFFGVTSYYARMTTSVKDKPAISIVNYEKNQLANTNTLSYDFKKILPRRHKLQIMLGQELTAGQYRQLTNDIDGFPTDFSFDDARKFTTEGTPVKINNFYSSPDRLLSFFGRAQYSYSDKYLATVTFRADGSSKFGPGNKWGYFPSAAFAWKMSEEPFMKASSSWLSLLKFRLSYGISGNDNIPGGQTIPEYVSNATTLLPFNTPTSYWSQGVTMSNPDLKWETTTSRNLGIDFSLLKSRLNGSLDIYHNTTKDQLILFPISGSGYNNQYRNMASSQNCGVEFQLSGAIVETRNFGLRASFNIAMNRNKVIDLGGLDKIEAYSAWASTQVDYDFVVYPGQSLGLIYGYVSDGRYSTSDFYWNGSKWVANEGVLDNSILTGDAWGPGAMKLADIGGDTSTINAGEDRTVLGCTLPKATGGFSISAQIYGFDISANFNYTLGNKILNVNRAEYTMTGKYEYNNILDEMNSSNRWISVDQNGNRITDTSVLESVNSGTTLWSPVTAYRFVTSYIVEDGSFLRLGSATIGYSFTHSLLRRAKLNELRLYVTGSNLFCLTKYTGCDPEVDTRRSTPMTPGVDYSSCPRTRGFVVGVNLTF